MPVFDDLKAKLQELFMFDRADLDFGMYRILNAKRAEVTRFLETELLPSARAALGSVTAEDQARLKAAEDAAREQARKFGAPDPDATPGVQEAQAAYKAATDTASIEEEIYSHLLAFFSRYYQEGDFIPQRRYSAAGRERYMIPYDGEEVKLVWANMEQYYIKSSESLTDYAFTFDSFPGKKRVEFKLIAATEENANNKSQTGERRFSLADLSANPATVSADGATLTLAFTYVEHPKSTKQADLLSKCEEALAAAAIPEPYKTTIFAADPSFTGKGSRTLLRKHLDVYAAKNTYDYFIHKDLGGFLRRELDYFIKSEVIRIDDLLPEDPSAARQQLKKVRALRALGSQIIAFMEQLENFQKKLWLKKKVVTEVRYCLTLDRISETFYPEIASNPTQRDEWKKLYSIQDLAADTAGQPGYPGDNNALTVAFLKANTFLVVDTGNFSPDFTSRLIASIPGIDGSLYGVCFNSENSQALEFMQGKYAQSVTCFYTDPPYNTGSDGFSYRDSFQHSSWLAMIAARFSLAKKLLSKDGSAYFSIDDREQANLRMVSDAIFGADSFVANVIWNKKYSPQNDATWLSDDHDFVMVYAAQKETWRPVKLERNEEQDAAYENPDQDSRGPWKAGDYTSNKTRAERPNLFYPITNPNTKEEVFPSENRVWAYSPDVHLQHITDNRIWWGRNGRNRVPAYKRFLSEVEGLVPRTVWPHEEVGHNQDAMRVLQDMFKDKPFASPKPPALIERCITISGGQLSLDIFAGSGTTGHAVINLNRQDKGGRRYILVEMGDYFESVLVPRLKKAIYSAEWKDGKPIRYDTGVSHAFKIVKLESYEDTLNNLHLPRRTPDQTLALGHATPEARADYMLRYSLELETRESPSLLELAKFSAPWSYQLSIHRKGETVPRTVDLVETFNWLVGLSVEHQDAPVSVAAEFETDSSGRITVKKGSLRKAAQGWTFQSVTGRDRSGRLQLIIWRSLSGNVIEDNAVLDAFFEKQGYNARDSEFDTIYVNGDNNLANLSLSAATPEAPSNYKVKLIESEFHRLMWDVQDV